MRKLSQRADDFNPPFCIPGNGCCRTLGSTVFRKQAEYGRPAPGHESTLGPAGKQTILDRRDHRVVLAGDCFKIVMQQTH
jgi:hypothetical protein